MRVRCSQLLQTRRGVPLCTYLYQSIERSLEKSRNCSPLEADLCNVISGSGKSFWRGVDLTAGATMLCVPPPPHPPTTNYHSTRIDILYSLQIFINWVCVFKRTCRLTIRKLTFKHMGASVVCFDLF